MFIYKDDKVVNLGDWTFVISKKSIYKNKLLLVGEMDCF